MQLCLCTVRQCGKVTNAAGERGVHLNARDYRKHQEADKAHHLRTAAAQTQAAALLQHDAQLTKALAHMSLMNPTITRSATPPPILDRYRADRIRRLIGHISEIKDSLSRFQDEAASIGSAPPSQSDVKAVHHALYNLKSLQTSAAELEGKLAMIARGSKDASVVTLRDETKADLKDFLKLLRALERSWDTLSNESAARRNAELATGVVECESAAHFKHVLYGAKPVIQLVVLMIVACHIILGFSRRGCLWLFSMSAYIVQTAIYKALPASAILPAYFQAMLSEFPRDLRTAVNQFNLDPKSTVYAACPACHEIYAPTQASPIPIYQERCTSRRYGSCCKAQLLRPKMTNRVRINVPIKPYIFFDFKDWMAGLLSRSGYEQMMDQAWHRMKPPSDKSITDIFQGSIVREFKGPDGKTHFSLAGGDGAGRYLFSVSLDFFNPLGNKQAGKKISVGVISLVCLNLPIEQRYKPENIFVPAIIPGPSEPPLDSINPYLRPLVTAFLEFWTGVRFTRTSKCDHGRVVFCAIVAVICDLPAARKIGAFSSHSHEYFCSVCWCNKTQHTYENIDIASWKRRTNEDCRHWASRFHESYSAKSAESSFDQSGLRWSELLRLPYYNPARFLVVEPMHNLFLGLIKEHFQGVLGYRHQDTPTSTSGSLQFTIPIDASNPLPETKPAKQAIRKLLRWLSQPLAFDEMGGPAASATIARWGGPGIAMASLTYVASGLDCFPAQKTITRDGARAVLLKPAKKDLAECLLDWRLRQKREGRESDAHNLEHGQVFTISELESLWEDIELMCKPSWAPSVPTTIGATGPKLKSDQWRVVGYLYLPVTLIRLWSMDRPGDLRSRRRHELLNLTMSLLSAIAVGTSRITSPGNAHEFLKHMIDYRTELKRLFPNYKSHPNHHMAMHIPEYLSLYGPVHGWWAYPFERVIGMLQRVSTNYKPGEYEKTIGLSWYQSSYFKVFFRKPTCPESLKHCADMFENMLQPHARDPLIIDSRLEEEISINIDDDDEFTLEQENIPHDIRAAFTKGMFKCPPMAQLINQTRYQGVSYTAREKHEGNSCVLLKGRDAPFCIEKILQFPTNTTSERAPLGTWIVGRSHLHARVTTDPYLKYPCLRARIWDAGLRPEFEVMPITDIDTHFAKCSISWEGEKVVVVVSLSRSVLF